MLLLSTNSRFATRVWLVLRVTLGILLLVAACLKLGGRLSSPIPHIGWFGIPPVQIAIAEWELILGVWLISGWYPVDARIAALATFLLFAVVSGYLGWIGVASCGCLGAVRSHPWHAFAADISAVATLLVIRPPLGVRISVRMQFLARCAGALALTGAILGSLASLTYAYFGSLERGLGHLRGERLVVRPARVDVG